MCVYMHVLAGVVATLENGVSMAMYFSGLAGRGGVQIWFGALKDGVSSPRRSLMAWKPPDAPESRSEPDTNTNMPSKDGSQEKNWSKQNDAWVPDDVLGKGVKAGFDEEAGLLFASSVSLLAGLQKRSLILVCLDCGVGLLCAMRLSQRIILGLSQIPDSVWKTLKFATSHACKFRGC
jgi:hypothetical protein